VQLPLRTRRHSTITLMKKTRFLLPALAIVAIGSGISVAQFKRVATEHEIITIQKMIVASGSVTMQLDTTQLNSVRVKHVSRDTLQFEAVADSFLPFLVANDTMRGTIPGAIGLQPKNTTAALPNLVLERRDFHDAYELVVRDLNTNFVFFNVEGTRYDYDAASQSVQIRDARLVLSPEFAENLGRPADQRLVVGTLNVTANLRAIEVRRVVNGEDHSAALPPLDAENPSASNGPDVIVGDLPSLEQFGSDGTRVGLAVATTSCNMGNVQLNWFQMPNTDHPVIPQNLYRMSGGTDQAQRFEQIGQSWLKHAFFAQQQNACGFGCQSSNTGTRLGVGCSDPYSAGLNADQPSLGSRAWVNPFTGAFPNTANNHSSHTHSGSSHRLAVRITDLAAAQNPGATYYAEAHYVTPHEHAWCTAHPGQCGPDANTNNNVSYRRFNVSGTTSFGFSPAGATVRMLPAIYAWTGADVKEFDPAPGADGRGYFGYKVSGPVNGVYHYEYALVNQNLDRAIGSFSVPIGCGVDVSNVESHAPWNEPGSLNDGTGGVGFSNTPWTATTANGTLTWSTETFAANPNANAIRWGTMHNFRFTSSQPPEARNAVIGFFKTGEPIIIATQVPAAVCAALSASSAVSRKAHGNAGTFDVQLPLSGTPGVEPRRGGADPSAHTLVFTFNNELTAGSAAVTSSNANVVGSPTLSGNTITVQLTSTPAAGEITLNLQNVTDSYGQTIAQLPFTFRTLFGDANRSSSVTASDISMVKANSGVPVTQANFTADVTADGNVSASDISATKSMSGAVLP
jgi:hypothetical protein